MSEREDRAEFLLDAITYDGGPFVFSYEQTKAVAIAFANTELERAARKAGNYMIEGHSIHPDIPQSGLSEQAKMIAHTTCQHVAEEIRKMVHE